MVRSHESNKSQAIGMNGVGVMEGDNIPMHTLDRVGIAFQCGADYIIYFQHFIIISNFVWIVKG